MALFEPRHRADEEEIVGSDAATRALSVTVVENDFVARVYENIAWAYDLTVRAGAPSRPRRRDPPDGDQARGSRPRSRGRHRHQRRAVPA